MANEKRLIDANRFLSETRFQHGIYTHQELKKEIENQTTVDAVEVVRCKDCKYWVKGATYCEHESGLNDDVYGDYFCSYGERRTDNVS